MADTLFSTPNSADTGFMAMKSAELRGVLLDIGQRPSLTLALILLLTAPGCGRGLLGRTVFNSSDNAQPTDTIAEEASKDGDHFSDDSGDATGPGADMSESESEGSGSSSSEADPTAVGLRLESVRTLKSSLCTKVTVSAVDAEGTLRVPSSAVTVTLGKTLAADATLTLSSSPKCASGTEINSLTLDGEATQSFYALPTGSGSATLTASAEGLSSAELSGTLAMPTWSEPETLGAVSGVSNLSGTTFHHALFPQMVDDGTGGATAFWLQGFNLMVNTIDSSGAWGTASEVDALPGRVGDFDAAGDVNQGEGVLVAWTQTVPSEGITAVFARVRTAAGTWAPVVRLSTEGKFSRSPQAAFSSEVAVAGWVVWEEGVSATDDVGGRVYGARISPADGSLLEGPTELSSDGKYPRVALGTATSGAVLTFTRTATLYSRSGPTLSSLTDATVGGPGALIDSFASDSTAATVELSGSGPGTGGLHAVVSWFDLTVIKAAILSSGTWSAVSTLDTGVSQTFARNGIDSSGNAFVSWRKYTTGMKPNVIRYSGGAWGAVQSWSGAGYLHGPSLSVAPAGSACLYMGSSDQIVSTVCYDVSTALWEASLATVPAITLETFPVSGVLLSSGKSHLMSVQKFSTAGDYRVGSFSRPSLSGTLVAAEAGAHGGLSMRSVSHAIDLGIGGEVQSFWDAPATQPALSKSQYRNYSRDSGFGSATALDDGPTGGVVATRIAQDAARNTVAIYVVRTEAEGMETYKVWSRRKLAGSSSWSDPVDCTGTLTLNAVPALTLRMNEAGDAIAVWTRGSTQLVGNTLDGSTGTWGTAQAIESSHAGSDFAPELTIDASGNGWLAYLHEGTSRDVQVRQFTKGSGWSTGTSLASGDIVVANRLKPISVAGDSNGRVVVCYIQNDHLYCRHYSEGTWATAEDITTGRTGHVVIADSQGTFHVAYADRSTGKVTVRDLGFGEATAWRSAVAVSGVNTSPESLEFLGASDALGNSVLAWAYLPENLQTLNSSTTTDIQVVRYTNSVWGAAESLKDGSGVAYLGSVAASMTGEALVSWFETGATGGLSLKAALLE